MFFVHFEQSIFWNSGRWLVNKSNFCIISNKDIRTARALTLTNVTSVNMIAKVYLRVITTSVVMVVDVRRVIWRRGWVVLITMSVAHQRLLFSSFFLQLLFLIRESLYIAVFIHRFCFYKSRVWTSSLWNCVFWFVSAVLLQLKVIRNQLERYYYSTFYYVYHLKTKHWPNDLGLFFFRRAMFD